MMACTSPAFTVRSRPLRISLPSISTCRFLISSRGTFQILTFEPSPYLSSRHDVAVSAHVNKQLSRKVRIFLNLEDNVALPRNTHQQSAGYSAIAGAKSRENCLLADGQIAFDDGGDFYLGDNDVSAVSRHVVARPN